MCASVPLTYIPAKHLIFKYVTELENRASAIKLASFNQNPISSRLFAKQRTFSRTARTAFQLEYEITSINRENKHNSLTSIANSALYTGTKTKKLILCYFFPFVQV